MTAPFDWDELCEELYGLYYLGGGDEREHLRARIEAAFAPAARITELEAQLAEAQANTAALIEQGRRAGIEEAARYVHGNYPFDKHDLVAVIRALLTSERDTKADSDRHDPASRIADILESARF